MTVLDNIRLGRHIHYKSGILNGSWYLGKTKKEEIEHRIFIEEEIIDLLEIEHIRYKPVGMLPYGLQKRVELGRALALEPEILILDEPLAGLNLEKVEDMAWFILDVNEEERWKVTCLLVEHDMGVVMDLSKNVFVLNFGNMIMDGTPEEVQNSPEVIKAYLGEEDFMQQEDKSIEITKELTIPKLFFQQATAYGKNKVAMREKEFGIWRPITWYDYLQKVKHIALGLVRMGLEEGDKVSMIGDNRPEGLMTEMAAICAKDIGVWLFRDCLIEEVKYIIDHSDSKFLICETQEEVDKAISIFKECPKLEKIIWDDPKGMRNYNQDYLISLKEVKDLGIRLNKEKPKLFEELVKKGHGDEVVLLFYTSGTTSLPKGVLLSHYNMLTMGSNLMAIDPCYENDDYVSFLPFAWIGEQMMSISCGLQRGFTINFPEKSDTAQENIREIGPKVIFAPPRMYEQMTRTVQVKYLDSTWIKRKCYELSTKIGYHKANLKFDKKPIPWYWEIANWFAYIIIHKKLKDHLGLSNIRNAYTGGAAMGPNHFRFFHAIGVNLKQIYGQTEIAGISMVHRDGDIKFDTVGKPIPNTKVKIGKNSASIDEDKIKYESR
eukprot:CAMPEP_0201285626 /NCGR_PEP_ID=MMETSP1317-20130820/113592_1 /ASSEMBLY_ACC=CAM_ASM_000770 /TAXON_ID=187299 /ORGANISM="Undescribed Undescribed, Strain Undescribed" /LENGTH=604 /DNA_ID=CAMNT_0047611273 /DNA_START=1393 /DNA_END=3204 /DNA_ORIENTATION=+